MSFRGNKWIKISEIPEASNVNMPHKDYSLVDRFTAALPKRRPYSKNSMLGLIVVPQSGGDLHYKEEKKHLIYLCQGMIEYSWLIINNQLGRFRLKPFV